MKKNLIKSTLAVAFLTVAGLGGMKAFQNSYLNTSELYGKNLEALSQGENPENYLPSHQCYTCPKQSVNRWGRAYLCIDNYATTSNDAYAYQIKCSRYDFRGFCGNTYWCVYEYVY